VSKFSHGLSFLEAPAINAPRPFASGQLAVNGSKFLCVEIEYDLSASIEVANEYARGFSRFAVLEARGDAERIILLIEMPSRAGELGSEVLNIFRQGAEKGHLG